MTVDITVPVLGESVTEATVMRWHKAPGDSVTLDETLVELETDKIAVEVKAVSAGALAEIVAGEGTDVEVGALLGRLEPGEGDCCQCFGRCRARTQDASAPRETVPARASARDTVVSRTRVPPPSPAVRRLLEEHGLDPTEIEGTGKGGRLLKSDVLAAVVARASSAAAPEPAPPSEPAQPKASPDVASPPKLPFPPDSRNGSCTR